MKVRPNGLNSLFGKFLGIFILVLIASNLVAVALVLAFSARWPLPEIPGIQGERFAFAFGLAFRMAAGELAAGVAFSCIAARIVVGQLRRISEVAKAVACGDFTARVTSKPKGKDELTEFSDNINLMVAELSRNEYLHQDFVSNVSHEFKTPIAAIQGYAELLANPNLSEEKRLEYAETVIRQSARLSRLATNLLCLSELEHGSLLAMQSETFSLDEQIREATLLLQGEWEGKGLDMRLELDPVIYEGNRALIYQVWVNLISNAVKFSRPGGTVSVELGQGDGEGQAHNIKVTVSDRGIGMSEEQCARAFERFYKADTSGEVGGSGLGLAIAKRIVEMHGGRIRATSSLGEGSVFIVEL